MKGDATKASAVLGMDREALAAAEGPVEQAVFRHLGDMTFL
ncbi:MAG TPA: hypothetical protein VM325_03310 [Alphaproteobacteria bacterium]|nr:hypothetical protein [Alphaproteobacteria bacterium]